MKAKQNLGDERLMNNSKSGCITQKKNAEKKIKSSDSKNAETNDFVYFSDTFEKISDKFWENNSNQMFYQRHISFTFSQNLQKSFAKLREKKHKIIDFRRPICFLYDIFKTFLLPQMANS